MLASRATAPALTLAQAPVRAALEGHVLVIEGIEKVQFPSLYRFRC